IDFFETVFSVSNLIVGSEQTDAIAVALRRWRIAATNAEMADRHRTKHLLHQSIEIAAAHDARQVSREFVFERDEVLTVVIRIVEPVAHDAHRFMKHLTPLLGWNYAHLHLAEILSTFVGFCGSVSRGEKEVSAFAIENLLAVGSDIDRVNLVHDLLHLTAPCDVERIHSLRLRLPAEVAGSS